MRIRVSNFAASSAIEPQLRFQLWIQLRASRSFEYPNFRVQKNFQRADQPVLPLMLGNDGNAIHLALMRLDKSGVFFDGRHIFPALQVGGIEDHAQASVLPDEWFHLTGPIPQNRPIAVFGEQQPSKPLTNDL